MELIERYVQEVGRWLPGSSRMDVKAELRDLLEEKLDARARELGRIPDEAMAAEMLLEFGKPSEIAMRYLPQTPCLIGPRLYHSFLRTMKWVVGFNVLYTLFLAVLSIPAKKGEVTSTLFLSGLESVIHTGTERVLIWIGMIVCFFALLERGVARETDIFPWDPLRLPPLVEDREILTAGQLAASWVAPAIGLYMTNRFFPQLGPNFRAILPWIDAAWIMEILLPLWVFVRGRWSRPLRWVQLGVLAYTALVFLGVILTTPVNTMESAILNIVIDPQLRALVTSLVLISFRVGLFVVLWEMGKLFLRHLRQRDGENSPEGFEQPAYK